MNHKITIEIILKTDTSNIKVSELPIKEALTQVTKFFNDNQEKPKDSKRKKKKVSI